MSVRELSDADFHREVLAAEVPVLVDVWAAWCTPCQALVPVMAQLADRFAGRAVVASLDADANLETVTRYDVRALPTLLLFDRGVLVERFAGAQSFGTLSRRLEQQLQQRAEGAAPEGHRAAPAAPVPAGAEAEARALLDTDEPLVVFKHSATCPISMWVKREYDAFCTAHPSVPTRLVVVQTERPLSNALESVTQVRHESPQAIVVQRGRVLWHASHRRVTASGLVQALQSAQPVPPLG